MAAAQQEVNTPPWVWRVAGIFGVVRLSAYLALAALPRDAQWQLAFIPLLLADVPWSFVYFFALPFPIGEAIVGPVWWTLMPYLFWRGMLRRRSSRVRSGS